MYFFILQQSFRGRGHDTYALIRYSGTQNRLTVSWQLCDKPLINPLDQCQYPCTPILPSPDPTLSCYQLTVFELGERWVCSFSDNDIDPTNLILKGQTLILLRGGGGGTHPMLLSWPFILRVYPWIGIYWTISKYDSYFPERSTTWLTAAWSPIYLMNV